MTKEAAELPERIESIIRLTRLSGIEAKELREWFPSATPGELERSLELGHRRWFPIFFLMHANLDLTDESRVAEMLDPTPQIATALSADPRCYRVAAEFLKINPSLPSSIISDMYVKRIYNKEDNREPSDFGKALLTHSNCPAYVWEEVAKILNAHRKNLKPVYPRWWATADFVSLSDCGEILQEAARKDSLELLQQVLDVKDISKEAVAEGLLMSGKNTFPRLVVSYMEKSSGSLLEIIEEMPGKYRFNEETLQALLTSKNRDVRVMASSYVGELKKLARENQKESVERKTSIL